jgi:phosphoribosylaminoimidazole-succinocarboxamide synthase
MLYRELQPDTLPVLSPPTHTRTGSTDTSLWTHYKAGAREYCGNTFPDGMVKNQRLASNVITPTTKSEVGVGEGGAC